jgi:hypothetical protein
MKTRQFLWAILALFLALPHSGTAQTPEDDPFHVPTLTLSKGKYIEIHDQDSIVQIGRALLNVKTQQLVGWAEEDTTYGNDAFQADVASRWLSPDPKSDEFSSWSPYNFVENNPIRLIDPDGRAPHDPIKALYKGLSESFNYLYLETAVDMAAAPSKGYGTKSYTSRGFQRNPRHYWTTLLDNHPEWFSEANVGRITGSRFEPPIVDDDWVKAFPTHKEYMRGKLIHHHHNGGRWGFALPDAIHKKFSGQLHALSTLMKTGKYGLASKYIPTSQKFGEISKKLGAAGSKAGKALLPVGILLSTYTIASANPGPERDQVVGSEIQNWIWGGIGATIGGGVLGIPGAIAGGIAAPSGIDYLEGTQDPSGYYKKRMHNLGLSDEQKATMTACFTGETEILSKSGFVAIDKLQPGDSVFSFNLQNQELELSKVSATLKKDVEEYFGLVIDNDTIFVTGEHPFYMAGIGWTKVKHIQKGQQMFTFSPDMSGISVLEIISIKKETEVFNITVDGNHNYLVNRKKVLIHNKDCFVAGSLVTMADGLQKPIEKVSVGDSVLAYNSTKGTFSKAAVLKIETPRHEEYSRIFFENGNEITCTPDHPFWAKGKGWASIAEEETERKYGLNCKSLQEEDYVLSNCKDLIKWVSIEKVSSMVKPQISFNLSQLSTGDGYIINGICVSNETGPNHGK